MKKLWCLILALCLVLSCAAFTASAESAELAPATLNVWIAGGGRQQDSEVVWEYFNEQLKGYLPNTTVEYNAFTFDEYGEKWSKAMAAGETIDVAWFGWMLDIDSEIAMGSLTPLDDLIAQYGQDVSAQLGEGIMEAHKIRGVTYAIPCWQGLAVGRGTEIVLYGPAVDAMENKNYIAELDAVLAQIKATADPSERVKLYYDKIEEFVVSAFETNTNTVGGYNPRSSYCILPQAAGGAIVTDVCETYIYVGDNDYNLHTTYITDSDYFNAAVLELSYLNDYFKKGYIRSDYLTFDTEADSTDGSMNGFMSGLMTTKPNFSKWYMGDAANDYHNSRNPDGVYNYIATSGMDLASEKGYATSMVIPYTSKEPERAMMYINLLSSTKGAELYKTLTYGIEGQHWDMNEDGSMNVYMGEGQADSTWPYGHPEWAMGTMLNSVWTPSEDPETWVKMQEMEQQMISDPLCNFAFDPTNVEMEILNFNAINEEYGKLFCYDDYEARLRERNDKIMAAGYELILDELKTQLNAYLEENNHPQWP